MPDTFTPEQISQILEEFFKVVGTRQYIGARYVPIFGRKGEDSIEWDNTAPYEPLTIVLYQGNSYTSRQYVPVGVEITNQEFWAITGNYNAQVEMYRRETAAAREVADNALTAANNAQNDINTLLPKAVFSAENTVKKYVDDSIAQVADILPSEDFSAENTIKQYIDRNKTRVLSFGTIEDMQNASYLESGMVCHTNGFHATGDSGAAYYMVGTTGIANGMDVLALHDELVATLVVTSPYLTPEQFGAYGDGTHDDSAYINRLIAFAYDNHVAIVFGERKTYALASSLTISNPMFVDLHGCTLKYTGNHESVFVNYYFDPASVKDAKLGIINGTIDANTLCDVALIVSGGKKLEIANLRIFNPLVTGIEFNKTNYDLWEMHAHDLLVNGANASGLTVDGIKVVGGVTDSFFNEIVISNASNAWLNAVCATNHFRNVHGYAYPAENHPAYGMILGGNNNIFENIVIDTPYDKGILSNGTSNIFRNIELLKFSATENRIGIIDNDYNTYDTIVANSDCDIVIQSNAFNFLSLRNMINFSRPGSDLQLVKEQMPYTFDIDLQSSRAVNKFMANFEHRNKYATTNTEFVVTLPIPFRSILDYDVFIVQKTISGSSGYPYTINKAADGSSIGITFYATSTNTVQFDMFIKPFKW